MGQTPRHVNQDDIQKMNRAWYWKGLWIGFVLGASIVTVIALAIVFM